MLLYSAVINTAAMLWPLMESTDDNHVEVKVKRMEAKAVCVTYYSRLLLQNFAFLHIAWYFFLLPFLIYAHLPLNVLTPKNSYTRPRLTPNYIHPAGIPPEYGAEDLQSSSLSYSSRETYSAQNRRLSNLPATPPHFRDSRDTSRTGAPWWYFRV